MSKGKAISMPQMQAGNTLSPIRPETLARIEAVIYDPRRCSSPDLAFRASREFLKRPDLDAKALVSLAETDAAALADALEKAFPDRGPSARSTVENFLSRP